MNQGGVIYTPPAIATNYSEVGVNDSLLWEGHSWDINRWLLIDGGNANQNIDIGAWVLSVGKLITSDRINLNYGDAGTPPMWNAQYDTMIIENDDHTNIQIFTPNNKDGSISFSDPEGRSKGWYQYQHASDRLAFGANGNNVLYLDENTLWGNDGNISLGKSGFDFNNIYFQGTLHGGAGSFSTNVETLGDFIGDGSQLTDLNELDPKWSANYSLYNDSWSSTTNTSYYLTTNPFSFYNSTNPQTETDPHWSANYTAYNTTWSTDTTYDNSSPIGLSGTTFSLETCADNEVLKMDGASWNCEADASGGGGGNPFDQSLNTSDNVIFEELIVNGSSQFNDSLFITNPSEVTASAGILKVTGEWVGATVVAFMNFQPDVGNSNAIGFQLNPNIQYNKTFIGLKITPNFLSGINQVFTGVEIVYPPHKTNFNDTYIFMGESGVNPRSFVNLAGKSDMSGIDIGDAFTVYNFGNEVDFEEDIITIRGGSSAEMGLTLSPTQKGLRFLGFGNRGTNASVEMIHADGGDINLDADNIHVYWGADKDSDMFFDGTDLVINMTQNGALKVMNTSGLGKIRASQYATSTPRHKDYNVSERYMDILPNPENLFDEEGKIKRGILGQAHGITWENDPDNCWEVGTGNYWWCYDFRFDKKIYTSCQFRRMNLTEQKEYFNEREVERMETECGQREINVTFIEEQADRNTIMIAELKAEIDMLKEELCKKDSSYSFCRSAIGI